jgi:hypothetical protein
VIAGLLSRAGCNLLAPAESFTVEGFRGPLDAGETERAEAWIRGLVRSVHPVSVAG